MDAASWASNLHRAYITARSYIFSEKPELNKLPYDINWLTLIPWESVLVALGVLITFYVGRLSVRADDARDDRAWVRGQVAGVVFSYKMVSEEQGRRICESLERFINNPHPKTLEDNYESLMESKLNECEQAKEQMFESAQQLALLLRRDPQVSQWHPIWRSITDQIDALRRCSVLYKLSFEEGGTAAVRRMQTSCLQVANDAYDRTLLLNKVNSELITYIEHRYFPALGPKMSARKMNRTMRKIDTQLTKRLDKAPTYSRRVK